MEQKLIRKIIQVDGMTCTSCEMRIENNLKKLEGVIEVKAIYSSSNVYVTYDANVIGIDKIIEEVEKLDYPVKNKSVSQGTAKNQQEKTKSKDHMSITQLGALNGVDSVSVDLKGKRVAVEYDPEKVTLQTIKDTIEDQGYDVE